MNKNSPTAFATDKIAIAQDFFENKNILNMKKRTMNDSFQSVRTQDINSSKSGRNRVISKDKAIEDIGFNDFEVERASMNTG